MANATATNKHQEANLHALSINDIKDVNCLCCSSVDIYLNVEVHVESGRVKDSADVVHNEGHCVGSRLEVAVELVGHGALEVLHGLGARILKGHRVVIDFNAHQSIIRRNISVQEVMSRIKFHQVK